MLFLRSLIALFFTIVRIIGFMKYILIRYETKESRLIFFSFPVVPVENAIIQDLALDRYYYLSYKYN